MTILDQTRRQAEDREAQFREDPWERAAARQRQQQDGRQGQNVGENERVVSIAAGAIVTLFGLGRRTIPGLVMAGVGAGLIYRGATGRSPTYSALDINTARPRGGEDEISERGVRILQAITINRPAEELYPFWRNFENLPRIMTHLQAVRVSDDRHSHWVARAPRLAGGQVEWDAEITADEPNRRIAWRSVQGADVDTVGEVRFVPALGDRGTEVHVTMSYVPPAGKLGHLMAMLSGNNPKRMIREGLRNFKRIMEIGEVLTIIGQPHGTCTGQGTEYTESEWKPMFA